MIYPSINELSKDGKFNRYTLVIAAAKCARVYTSEYVKERQIAERMIANKETDRPLSMLLTKEYRDEKAVKIALDRMMQDKCRILFPGDEGYENAIVDMEPYDKVEPLVPEDRYLEFRRDEDDDSADDVTEEEVEAELAELEEEEEAEEN